MKQRQKKILLLILLVVFVVLLTYQLRRIDTSSGEVASLRISSEVPSGGRISHPSLQGKSLLPEVNLELLHQQMPAYSVLGRNLFRFEAAKATTPSSPRQPKSSDTRKTTASREIEEEGGAIQTTSTQEAPLDSSQALVELAGFKFLGFAKRDSHLIATLKKGDKVLVGIKGEIIEEKFTILEIDYQYVELGVVNTSFKQKIPLVSGSF